MPPSLILCHGKSHHRHTQSDKLLRFQSRQRMPKYMRLEGHRVTISNTSYTGENSRKAAMVMLPQHTTLKASFLTANWPVVCHLTKRRCDREGEIERERNKITKHRPTRANTSSRWMKRSTPKNYNSCLCDFNPWVRTFLRGGGARWRCTSNQATRFWGALDAKVSKFELIIVRHCVRDISR